MTRIGVISDTHGLLRPEALEALAGSDHIIHAGDVGKDRILQQLETIAPVTAVSGNVDTEPWAADLPVNAVVEIDGRCLYVLHIREELDLDLASAGMSAFIFGHSHKPDIDWLDGILYLNPGSSGAKRFSNPVTLARIDIDDAGLHPELIHLEV